MPSFIFSNKPRLLGDVLKDEAGLNVAFAFNPIAEGLINFGFLSVLSTPILMYMYIFFANKFKKCNYFMYMLFYGYVMNFFRGMFAVMIFDFIVFYIFYTLLFKERRKEELYEGIFDFSNCR